MSEHETDWTFSRRKASLEIHCYQHVICKESFKFFDQTLILLCKLDKALFVLQLASLKCLNLRHVYSFFIILWFIES